MTSSPAMPLLEEGYPHGSQAAVRRHQEHPRRLRGGNSIAVCGVITVLVVLLLIPFLFTSTVPPNHVGISYDSLTQKVDLTNFYRSGRHWSGLFATYKIFPLNVQNVDLELDSRTSEGYTIGLKVSFQYQLIEDQILELYKHYTIKYAPVFERNVRAALMKSTSDYSADDLFKKREAILSDMYDRIDRVLRESYARCWGIQFDDVHQNAAFENTLLQTQLTRWFAQTKLAEQKVSAIQAQTSVLKAEFDKNISVVNSTATAKCQYILSQASADSANYQNEAQANATLMTDKANAQGSSILREAKANSELAYQEAVASGSAHVGKENAEANMRTVELEGLKLKYWKEEIGLSPQGLIQFQKLLGDYKHLEDVKFLFGFENAYATAEASPGMPGTTPGGKTSTPKVLELAAVGGSVAGAAAAQAEMPKEAGDKHVLSAPRAATGARHLAEGFARDHEEPEWNGLEL